MLDVRRPRQAEVDIRPAGGAPICDEHDQGDVYEGGDDQRETADSDVGDEVVVGGSIDVGGVVGVGVHDKGSIANG